MSDRSLYLAIRIISRLRDLDEAQQLEAEALPHERASQRTEVLAAVLAEEEGISDPILVQLVLAAVPVEGPPNPPSKDAVCEFAAFLENQLHLSESKRE